MLNHPMMRSDSACRAARVFPFFSYAILRVMARGVLCSTTMPPCRPRAPQKCRVLCCSFQRCVFIK